MVEEVKWLDDKVELSNEEDLSIDTTNFTESLKINVEDILSFDNILLVKKYFDNLWFENYYDFYFSEAKEFRELLSKNENLNIFFKKVVWKQNFKNSYTWTEQILMFAERIWYKKSSLSEIRNHILSDLSEQWVTYLNEYNVFWLNKFKKYIKDNSYLKFLIYKKLGKSYANIDFKDFEKLWEYLSLKLLTLDETKNEIKLRLKDQWLVYLEDLDNITVRWFWKIVSNDKLFIHFLHYKNMELSDINDYEKVRLAKSIWLKNKEFDKLKYLTNFLKTNGISNYWDLRELWINWARDFLWSDSVCKEFLSFLWLNYLKDFREEHLKKFSRFVWLNWISEEKEIKDFDTIEKIKLKLLNEWIECDYSLKLYWLNKLKRLFKEKIIWEVLYSEINWLIKSKIWVIIPLLSTKDLEQLSQIIWLPKYNDLEHKEKLVSFLKKEGLDLDTLTRNHIKVNYWYNPQFRYFLEKVWINDVKLLRLEHMNQMKQYIESI